MIRAFETALRQAIERADFAAAESLIREKLAKAPDPVLQSVLDRPLNTLRITDWHLIASCMDQARRSVWGPEIDRDWEAVLLGLINRNDVEGLPISVQFTFNAEPGRADVDYRPSFMTEADYQVWKNDNESRILLPTGAKYPSVLLPGRPRIEGLEDLRSVHARAPQDPSDRTQQHAVWLVQSLAAAIVLLRFHQLIERYSANPGLPQTLTVFAFVATATRPMETNTVDYGIAATRMLRARIGRYDSPSTARAAGQTRAERVARIIAETNTMVAALREFSLALSLWPGWRSPMERMKFNIVASSYFDQARVAVAQVAPSVAPTLHGEDLCQAYARVRLGENAVLALDAVDLPERTPVHRLSIAIARKFGGRSVSEALAHVPPPPEELLRSGDFGL